MKKILILTSAVILGACQSTTAPIAQHSCNGPEIIIDADFDNARVNDCSISGNNQVNITITPENQPINDSPWYAFKASSPTQKTIEVIVKYKGGKHRYSPKIRQNKQAWQAIKHDVKNNQLRFTLDIGPQPVTVAGQELITNANYAAWMKNLARQHQLNYSILGKSTQQRGIGQLEITQPNNKEWLIVLGRMHPPEVTGALALSPFVEQLLSNSVTAQKFRQRFNVLVVPNVNPDGVAMGNWRHNAAGVDLNRDWKKFAHVESTLVRDKLNAITNSGGKIVFALDFHSTHKNIFYTMPTDYGLNPPYFTQDWLNALATSAAPFKVIQKPGNNPDMGVFKQYIADTFNVHAITYEMGDNTNRGVIRDVAQQASDRLMETLLTTKPEAFYQSKR